MKLLIIDDQEEVGEIISEIAMQMGWEIATSHTADDVVEAILRDGVDAIFIDYFMPGKKRLGNRQRPSRAELPQARNSFFRDGFGN